MYIGVYEHIFPAVCMWFVRSVEWTGWTGLGLTAPPTGKSKVVC